MENDTADKRYKNNYDFVNKALECYRDFSADEKIKNRNYANSRN